VTAQIGEQARALTPLLLTGAMNAVEFIAMSLLALVLLFFLLRDGRAMARFLATGLAEANRDCALRAGEAGWKALQAYVRGTAIIAAIDAVGIGIGLLILGVPLALPLTLITFIASFVPLIGATVAGTLAVLVALASDGLVTALLVLGVVLLVQNVEGNLLEPLIMGRAVRLHPAVILIVVSAGALVAGVGGALLATPLTAAVYRMAQVLRDCPGPPPEPAQT
jgi:predicted PurR-regulated permease PerM